jgi:hypothetical protein
MKPESSIFNDDIETPSDLLHRGTRTEGVAQVDSQGRAREQFDETGRPLAVGDDGALHLSTNGAVEEPPALSPERQAQAQRLKNMRECISFLALGERDFEKIGRRAAMICHLLFPHASQRKLAEHFKVSEKSIRDYLRTTERELAAFLQHNSAPSAN